MGDIGQGNDAREEAKARLHRLAAAGVAVLLVTLSATSEPGRHWLETKAARPLAFALRHRLGRDPGLSPRVKLYAFGDTSKERFERDALTLDEWREILVGLAPSRPAAVVIDNLFSTPPGLEHAAAFAATLRKLPFPVYAGAFLATSPIRGRSALPFEAGGYELRELVEGAPAGDPLAPLRWLPITSGFAYGPHRKISAAFTRLGQMRVDEVTDTFRPLVRLTPEHALSALPLLAAGPMALRDGALYVNGTRVPLDAQGRTLVNYSAPEIYRDQVHPLAKLLSSIREGLPPEQPANAVLFFLTQLTTGDTKFLWSPFGQVPTGLASIAALESALTGAWLARMPFDWLLLLAAGLLGIALAERLGAMRYWTAQGLVGLLAVGAGNAAFVYGRFELPWLSSILVAFTGGLIVFVDKARVSEHRKRRLHEALEGMVSPAQLRSFLQRPGSFHFEPTGRVVTVMFIDIVGFSTTAERHSPRDVFHSLRELIAELAEAVHRHGGIVDKTIGDGMLCFFGYAYDGTQVVREHPDQALRCAIEIQRETLRRQLESAGKRPLYPLRIGIHTAAVYIGNLGGTRKIDMTLIGHGVNLAKRLESACDSYSIMLSAATRDLLTEPERLGAPLVRRYVQIKNYDELVEVYECDPLANAAEQRTRALAAFRDERKVERRSQRWPVPADALIEVTCEAGRGLLLNFSDEGLAVHLDRYLGRGVTLTLHLDPEHADGERLRALGMSPLVCEVRWGRPDGNGAGILGLHVRNLSQPQRLRFLEELRRIVAARTPRRAAG